jgi:ABC-type antimicrobial peptide transport system permease subunit
LGVTNLNPKEIAITLIPGASDENAKNYIIQNLNNDQSIIVQTAMEAIPGGILDVFKTLRFIGNLIGSIGLIVGAITIFIVIFVNAITRRKYIGILKGIGISSAAIEISYTVQALFYAVSGITLGAVIIMALLKPYLDIHPINTALAPAVLSVSAEDVFTRGIALLMTAFISGFIPAWLITKQNTLDAILGR